MDRHDAAAASLQSLPVEVRLQIFDDIWQSHSIAQRLRGGAVLPLMRLTMVSSSLRQDMAGVWRSYASDLQKTWHTIDCRDKSPSPYSPINEHRRLELARALAARMSEVGFRIAASIEGHQSYLPPAG